MITFETRDRMIWEPLDELGRQARWRHGGDARTAAGAVLSQEALGAHGADRNEERVPWALEAIHLGPARELGVEAKTRHAAWAMLALVGARWAQSAVFSLDVPSLIRRARGD